MSTILAQNATQMAVSNGTPDWTEAEFSKSAENAAERSAKGVTRERQLLNRNKLISAVCADFRAHFPKEYGKTDRLPTRIFNMAEQAVDKFINSQLARVNTMNAISFRRSFFHNSKHMEITERVQSVGENKLTLKEQLFGVDLYIGQAEKRLKELEAKPTPDYDRERTIKQQIMQLHMTRNFILGEMKSQEELTKPSVS